MCVPAAGTRNAKPQVVVQTVVAPVLVISMQSCGAESCEYPAVPTKLHKCHELGELQRMGIWNQPSRSKMRNQVSPDDKQFENPSMRLLGLLEQRSRPIQLACHSNTAYSSQ